MLPNLNAQMHAIEQKLKKRLAQTEEGARDGVEASARDIYDASQELVPVKSGRLKNSGFVEITETAIGTQATVGYRAPYAAEVHEDFEGKHAKFLQKPAFEHAHQIPNKVADAVKRKLR